MRLLKIAIRQSAVAWIGPKTLVQERFRAGCRWLLTLGMLVSVVMPAGVGYATPTFLGPSTPYLSFADSPFAGQSFSYFHLEDLEDGLLNTPGLSASNHLVVSRTLTNSQNVDSVDADDGSIDGSGLHGHSMWVPAPSEPNITLTFDDGVLGTLPTHVGVVWTDGLNQVEFEAFDELGFSLGTLNASPADGNFVGGTSEDTFFGVIHSGGVSSIKVTSGIGNVASGIELDHVQYGYASTVPEPATYAMAALALLGLGGVGLRRRRQSQSEVQQKNQLIA